MTSTSFDTLVEQAKLGNKAALEELVSAIQNQVYNLALRMLGHPTDAEDATQEILLVVITHLSQFRGESNFTTWVYRIATNHLLHTRKRRLELREQTFEKLDEVIDLALNLYNPQKVTPLDKVEEQLLAQEIRLRCTLAMLLCMDREHRLAYILGEIFGVSGEEGGAIMDVPAATFRKRLSRARLRLRGFMESHCGLVNPANPCRCEKHIPYKKEFERLSMARLLFVKPELAQPSTAELMEQLGELDKLDRIAGLFRSHPQYSAPERLVSAIKELFATNNFNLLTS